MFFRNLSTDIVDDNDNFFNRFINRTNSFHPLLFGHVLIRLGHEPWSPALKHTPLSFMGLSKRVYMYPWIGRYVWDLMRDVGFVKVCTAGYACSCIASALMSAAEDSALRFINRSRGNVTVTDETESTPDVSELEMQSGAEDVRNDRPSALDRHPSVLWALRSLNNVNDVDAMRPENEEVSDVIDILCEERSVPVFVIQFLHLLLWRLYGIIISHPFRVVMVRQIAYAAAGGSRPYTWFPMAARQVYLENGILGFFQGLLPSMLAEALVLSSVINIHRLLRIYLLDDYDSSISHLVRSILWIFHNHYIREPLFTVSDVLAIRGSGVNLPADPQEVASAAWSDCWDHLVTTGQILRASSWFFRRRVPAHVIQALES